MNNYNKLADKIQEKFTPFVFKCGCKGSHPECARIMESPAIWAHYDSVKVITNYIRNLDGEQE
jgi:hypothetical protein